MRPFLRFLSKFWGLSAWMLELIMILPVVLRKFSDLSVVSPQLIVNAVLSLAQEHRAAGVGETLRKRLSWRDNLWTSHPRQRPLHVQIPDATLPCGVSQRIRERAKIVLVDDAQARLSWRR